MVQVQTKPLTDHPGILIIEDDPQILDFLEMRFNREGFSVEIADSGRAGIDLFYQSPPKLVILDLRYPDIDSMEICKRIRSKSNVPIIVLSACDQSSEEVTLLTVGADYYIVKPFSFDELLARVRSLLRRARFQIQQRHLRFQDQ